jgi:hypothetical protein
MSNSRLRQIEINLSLLREQLGALEQDMITAPAEEKTRLAQRIRLIIKPQIQQ